MEFAKKNLFMDYHESFFYKFILPLLVSSYIILSPTLYWVLVVGGFITSDLILRLIVCKRNGVTISSEKMWRTVYKFGYAMVFILTAHLFQFTFYTDIPIVKIIASYLVLVELRSIDEKAQEITGNSLFNLVIEKFSIRPKNKDINKDEKK